MVVALCPSCEGQVNLQDKVGVGEKVRCPHCYEDLEVIETDPIELDWAYEEDDWDDDWDDDDWDDEDDDWDDDDS
jgi:lysine biosynthesis protein LysW